MSPKISTAGRCRSRTHCRTCNWRHHQAICQRGQATPAARTSRDTAETMTSRNTHETTTLAMSSTSTESAPVQTAKAVAKSHMTGTVRLLLDGGSQPSYITEDTRQRLLLPTHRQERLKIEGGNGVVATNADVVIVEIHSLDGTSSSVLAIVVPKIASSINNQSTIHCQQCNDTHTNDYFLVCPGTWRRSFSACNAF